jgi:hypothetical protein
MYNGYFVTTVLNPFTDASFNDDQLIVTNIKPDAGGSPAYEMWLFETFSSSKKSVEQGESFSVFAQLANLGTATFSKGGNVGIALVNSNDQLVEIIGTAAINTDLGEFEYFKFPHTISCNISKSVPVGQYQLKAVVRPNGGSWETITNSYNCPTNIAIQVAQPVPPSLAVSANSLDFSSSGGQKTFTVSSNVSWTASSNAISWLTVSPASGSNNGTIIITAQTNTTVYERIGIITVSGGGIKQTITVLQSPDEESANRDISYSPVLQAYVSNGILYITGLQPGKPFKIHNLYGQLIYSGIAKSEKEQLSNLTQGFYIIVAGDKTIKINIK